MLDIDTNSVQRRRLGGYFAVLDPVPCLHNAPARPPKLESKLKVREMTRAPRKRQNLDVRLIRVLKNDTHVEILYELLSMRAHSISHKSMPPMLRHKEFVFSHPYRVWYIMKASEGYVGSIYLTNGNNIGISTVRGAEKFVPSAIGMILKRHKPLPAIRSARSPEFDFNVSPSNKRLIAALKSTGAKLVQVTYAFEGARYKG